MGVFKFPARVGSQYVRLQYRLPSNYIILLILEIN